MPDKTIVLTEAGQIAISEMGTRVGQILAVFGENSDEYRKACESGFTSLLNVFRLGGRVMRDGEAFLLCVNDHIAYGVVPHRRGEPVMDVQPVEWSVHS